MWPAGARADAEIYREATARLRGAAGTRPGLVALTRVVEQLGRLVGEIDIPRVPPREPVPGWLADRLIFTAGIPREEVAALDLQQAVDLWSAYTSRPAKET